MKLVYGPEINDALGQWAAERIPAIGTPAGFGRYVAIGVGGGNRVVAVAVFHNWRPPNVELSMAADSPRWCRPRIVGGILSYPFGDMGVRNVVTVTPRRNKRARRLNAGLGFREAGTIPAGMESGDDMVIGYLTRAAAERWLRRT